MVKIPYEGILQGSYRGCMQGVFAVADMSDRQYDG